MPVFRSMMCTLFFSALPCCFAAVGPTVGIDLPTGRATLGVEASAATFTVAQSVALGSGSPLRPPATRPPNPGTVAATANPQSDSKYWRARTYLLWEPGLPLLVENRTWVAAGASLGVRWEIDDDATNRARFTEGGWLGAAHAHSGQESSDCQASDTRPYLALVVGLRGQELYASPKMGVLEVPKLCLFGPGDHLFNGGL